MPSCSARSLCVRCEFAWEHETKRAKSPATCESVEYRAHDRVGQQSAGIGEHQPIILDFQQSVGDRGSRMVALWSAQRSAGSPRRSRSRSITSSVWAVAASSSSKSAIGSTPFVSACA